MNNTSHTDYTIKSWTPGAEIHGNTSVGFSNSSVHAPAGEAWDNLRSFVFIVDGPILATLCVLGLLGNTLIFLVLWREKSNNQVAPFLLKVLAVTDNLMLINIAILFVPRAFINNYYDVVPDHILDFYWKCNVFLFALASMARFANVWITVLIAAVRWTAICRPFISLRCCTMARVRLKVLIVFSVTIVFNIPHFFALRIDYDPQDITSGYWLKASPIYVILYETILHCLFVFIVPFTVLIVLNVALIRELVNMRKRTTGQQMATSERAQDEQSITKVMVAIIGVFLLCQTPPLVDIILYSYCELDSQNVCTDWVDVYYLVHTNYLLVTFNSAINCVLYSLLRKRFRAQLCMFFRRDDRKFDESRISMRCLSSLHTSSNLTLTENIVYVTKL